MGRIKLEIQSGHVGELYQRDMNHPRESPQAALSLPSSSAIIQMPLTGDEPVI